MNGVTSNESHFYSISITLSEDPNMEIDLLVFFIFTPGKNFRPSFLFLLFRINKDCIFKIMFLLISYYSFRGCQNYLYLLCFILFIYLLLFFFFDFDKCFINLTHRHKFTEMLTEIVDIMFFMFKNFILYEPKLQRC